MAISIQSRNGEMLFLSFLENKNQKCPGIFSKFELLLKSQLGQDCASPGSSTSSQESIPEQSADPNVNTKEEDGYCSDHLKPSSHPSEMLPR